MTESNQKESPKRNVFGLAFLLFIVLSFLCVYVIAQRSVSGVFDGISKIFNPETNIIADPTTIVHEIRAIARLETIQYSMEKVITAETNQGFFAFLVGDKLLFVAHGDVIAGVDMSKIEDGDLYVENEILYVRLPEAEIFIASLDNDKSYVYDREIGVFSQGEVGLETQVRQAAEEEILNAALEDGILEQAQINAENYLFRLFRSLGYPEVVFLEPNSGN